MSLETLVPDRIYLYAGNCIDLLSHLPANSIHSVVTDPPYDQAAFLNALAGATCDAVQRVRAGSFCRHWNDGCSRVS